MTRAIERSVSLPAWSGERRPLPNMATATILRGPQGPLGSARSGAAGSGQVMMSRMIVAGYTIALAAAVLAAVGGVSLSGVILLAWLGGAVVTICLAITITTMSQWQERRRRLAEAVRRRERQVDQDAEAARWDADLAVERATGLARNE